MLSPKSDFIIFIQDLQNTVLPEEEDSDVEDEKNMVVKFVESISGKTKIEYKSQMAEDKSLTVNKTLESSPSDGMNSLFIFYYHFLS